MPKKSKKRTHKKFIKKAQFVTFFYLLEKLFLKRWVKIILGITTIFCFLAISLYFALRPKVQNEINYGINFSNKYATELGLDWKQAYIQILNELDVDSIRLVAYWDEVEAENNVFDFSNIKWQVEEAQKRDVDVILVMGRKVLRYPECHEPDWWNKIENEQEKNTELFQYLTLTVNEFKDYQAVKMWQVENEPFFPFGECEATKLETLKKEVGVVRNLDSRPILIQDSGEGGFWFLSYKTGDYLGISMYRRIWYDFWSIFLGRFIYFKYPLAHWSYKIKADLVGVPYDKIIVTELQAEPWGPGINSALTTEEKDKTMSKHLFLTTVTYAQKAGFKNLYFWGTEWWLFEKEVNNNSYFWDTAKAIINN